MKTVIRPLVPRMEYGLRLVFRRIPYSFLVTLLIYVIGVNPLNGQRLSVTCYNSLNVSINTGHPTKLNLYSLTPMDNLDDLVATIDDRDDLVLTCEDIGTEVMVMITDTMIHQSCMVIINVENKAPLKLLCKDTAITRLGNINDFNPTVLNNCLDIPDLDLVSKIDCPIIPFDQPSDTVENYQRKWTFASPTNDTSSCISTIYRIREKIPPVIEAVADTTIEIDEDGYVTLDSSVFIISLTDNSNCIASLTMTGSGLGPTTGSGLPFFDGSSFYTFSCKDTGTYNVEIIAIDCDENKDTVVTQLVVDDAGNCNTSHYNYLSGQILVHGSQPLADVSVDIKGSMNATLKTDESGFFEISYNKEDEGSEISIFLEDSWHTGLSVIDLKMIQDHILGLHQLKDWQIACADFDNSGVISAKDLVEIRRIILGYEYVNELNEMPWIFSDRDMKEPFRDSYNFLIQPSLEPKMEFIAAKRGDVNGDIKNVMHSRSSRQIPVQVMPIDEQQSKIILNLESLYLSGVFQFSIDIHQIEDLNILSDHDVVIERSKLKYLYYGQETSYQNLELLVKHDVKSSPQLDISTDFNSVLYAIDGNSLGLSLSIISEPKIKIDDFGISIYPNPTNSSSFLSLMDLPIDSDLDVRLFDLQGRQIMNKYWARDQLGSTTKTLNLAELPQVGTYIVYIRAGHKIKTQHIIKY